MVVHYYNAIVGKCLCGASVHPDRVHSLGLPADFLEMATRKAAQLNDAYRKIKAVRKAETVES